MIKFDLTKDLTIYKNSLYDLFKQDVSKLVNYNGDTYYFKAYVRLTKYNSLEGDIKSDLNVDISINNFSCKTFIEHIEDYLLKVNFIDLIMNSQLIFKPVIDLVDKDNIIMIRLPAKLISTVESNLNPVNIMNNIFLNQDSKLANILLKNRTYIDDIDDCELSKAIIFSFVLYGIDVLSSKGELNHNKVKSIPLSDFGIRDTDIAYFVYSSVELMAKEFEYSKLGMLFLYTNGRYDESGALNSIRRFQGLIDTIEDKLGYKIDREVHSNEFLKLLSKN